MGQSTPRTERTYLGQIALSRRLADMYEEAVWLDVRIALDNGVPMEQITEAVGCDRATVYRKMKAHNLTRKDS